MTELKLSITLSIILLSYYTYFQVISEIFRIGMIHNKRNETISRLRTEYKVTIRTFQKNTSHHGFAWFRTIYLNENLFRNKKALVWTFHHEYYHLTHKHKRNLLFHRFVFALTPLLLLVHWSVFTVVFVAGAWGMEYMRKKYEKNANIYANDKINHS